MICGRCHGTRQKKNIKQDIGVLQGYVNLPVIAQQDIKIHGDPHNRNLKWSAKIQKMIIKNGRLLMESSAFDFSYDRPKDSSLKNVGSDNAGGDGIEQIANDPDETQVTERTFSYMGFHIPELTGSSIQRLSWFILILLISMVFMMVGSILFFKQLNSTLNSVVEANFELTTEIKVIQDNNKEVNGKLKELEDLIDKKIEYTLTHLSLDYCKDIAQTCASELLLKRPPSLIEYLTHGSWNFIGNYWNTSPNAGNCTLEAENSSNVCTLEGIHGTED